MINNDLRSLWEQRLAEHESSGKTIKAWCQEQSLRENQFYYWRKKLRMERVEKGQPVRWLSINIADAKKATITPDSITVHVDQVTIEIKKGFDQSLFREIIQVLKAI